MTAPSVTAVMGVDGLGQPSSSQPHPSMAMYGAQMAGAPVVGMPPGAAPYPLYGTPYGMGSEQEKTPFYRTWGFAFLTGALLVGSAWFYFDFVRPKLKAAT